MSNLATFSILCIEDNDANMLVIQRIVESQAFHLFKANTAEAGIAMARQYPPDLILMDMNLPGIDGLEATRLLKRDTQLSHIPVIAVTASTMISREVALAAGCADHVMKPVSLSKLLVVLKRYVLGQPNSVISSV